jgi:hypothetical protein
MSFSHAVPSILPRQSDKKRLWSLFINTIPKTMQECRKVCVCVCIKQGNQTKKCVCVLKKIKKQGYQRMNTYNAGMKCEPGCVD